jgi:ABC-2 type transport system permease protein
MWWRRSAAIARQDLRILRRDPAPLVVFVLMPLIVMAFNQPQYRLVLRTQGFTDANGSEQAVPGMALLFAFFLSANVGLGIFREHGWGTWPRLRASWASPAEILLGKALTPLLSVALQLAVLLGLGAEIFDMQMRGSWPAYAAIGASLAVMLVLLGFALAAVCTSVAQLNAAASISALVLAGLGGAMTPLNLVPGWASAIAPATPSYWALRGFRTVILEGGDLAAVGPDLVVLGGFSLLFGAVALARFRLDEVKIGIA